jgi:O-antigen/teichoic acid export membrane protein
MFCIIVISIFSLEGIKLFVNNDLYWNSAHVVYVVALLSFASLFSMLKDQALMGLHLTKKTKITGTVIVIATVVNVVLNAILIPFWGIYGSAIGMLISQVVFFWIIYYKAQQVYFIPYELKKIYLLLFVGFIIIGVGLMLNPINGWIRIPIKLILLALYFVVLYRFHFFDTVEKEAIKKILHAWKNPEAFSQNIKRLFS